METSHWPKQHWRRWPLSSEGKTDPVANHPDDKEDRTETRFHKNLRDAPPRCRRTRLGSDCACLRPRRLVVAHPPESRRRSTRGRTKSLLTCVARERWRPWEDTGGVLLSIYREREEKRCVGGGVAGGRGRLCNRGKVSMRDALWTI